ncbi:MAG TPA: hypothetical protein VEC36_08695 [Patescibacteria group bacterium]|nr:hypothetical protein [Patescibacteria group bacterium]
MKKIATILVFFLLRTTVFADGIGYSEIKDISIESEHYIFKHHHDWFNFENERFKMISNDHYAVFKKSNSYAYVEVTDKNGKLLFNKPSPALTRLFISPDEEYYVGLSRIKLDNPYNFVVWDKAGKLIAKVHFTSEEAKLTKQEFEDFKKKFPKQARFLKKWERIKEIDNVYYIDAYFMNSPNLLGRKAWYYLYEFHVRHHLSPNIEESTSNWVYYYDEKNPDVQFEYLDKNVLKSISLNDPKGEQIVIPIK